MRFEAKSLRFERYRPPTSKGIEQRWRIAIGVAVDLGPELR